MCFSITWAKPLTSVTIHCSPERWCCWGFPLMWQLEGRALNDADLLAARSDAKNPWSFFWLDDSQNGLFIRKIGGEESHYSYDLYCVQDYLFENEFSWNKMFLTCKICLETCLERGRNEFCIPPKISESYLLGVQSVVYIKQGPRSGIFSVYILRNVDYILLTYSCPRFCVQFLF